MFLKTFLLIFCSVIVGDFSKNADLDWWQTTVIYQIYPRSFKDSNEDGIGDLKGIEEQAQYFKDSGIGTVWLSPIYKSPMSDMGYDISDFKAIDPIFGTMDDFISLQKKLESLDIKLIMDFVPNHSSDEHEWFKKSVQKLDPYTNYYIWREPKSWVNGTTPVPPNNWVSVFGDSAWKFNAERKQYYLHQFGEKQPDLNFRSEKLLEEMKDVLRFWLDKGVNGIRTDSVPYLVEDVEFRDEPIITNKTVDGKLDHDSLNHIYTMNQPESYDIVRKFREVLDSYTKKGGATRILLTEAYTSVENTIKFYGNSTQPIAHIPFNFFLLTDLSSDSNAKAFDTTIHKWMDKMPPGAWANWVIGNHDNPRIPSRFDASSIDSLNMLLLLLPGTAITYNGEEIGMTDAKIRWDQTTDILALNIGREHYTTVSRDPARTPFQWNSSIHAGFSKKSGNTWLPVNPNYDHLNLEIQRKDPKSHYGIYKSLLKLRLNEVIRSGELNTYVVSDWVFAFKRSIPEEEMFIVILNLNNEEEYLNLNTSISNLPKKMNVIVASSNSEYNAGDELNSDDAGFKMRPKSGLVLQAVLRKEPPTSPLSSSSSYSVEITVGLPILLLALLRYISS